MAIKQTIKLDLIPKYNGKMPILNASQYDIGREFRLELTEMLVPYTLTGNEVLSLAVRKADNTLVTMDIANTYGDKSYVEFATTEQMCACAGMGYGELRIKEADKDIGTLNFTMWTEQSPEEGGVRSDSEINNLARQVNEMVDAELDDVLDDYYKKTETYSRGEIDNKLDDKANADDVYTKTDVDNALNNKMDKANPTGTGSFSLNRKANTVIGDYSHTEGYNNEASGSYSHAEGGATKASIAYAHAEGSATKASGIASHAEGGGTTSFGIYSHAEGVRTVANHKAQHVFGEWNKPDTNLQSETERGDYVEIVGNGTPGNQSNARTLDWQGNEMLAGDLTFNGNKSLTSEISRLDGKIDNLPAPMIFKGTLGVGGTIQNLPTASASNEGWTYKVITDGTYAGQTAKVGDVFTSNGSEWVYIPSGDEDNDTWRAIKVNGTEVLGNVISSGAVDFVGSENIEIDFDGNGNKVGVKTKNIYTKTEVDSIVANEVSEAIYNMLPSELTPTSPIANFSTTLELPIVDISVDNSATKIYQFGSNLWNEEWEQGTYDTTTGEKTASTSLKRNIKPIPVKENTTYTRVKTQTGALLACRLFFYDDDMNLLATEVNTSNIYSFTTPVGCSFLNFAFQNNITALSVNYPDTDTTLNTYNPASGEYPIAEKDNIIPFVGVNNIFTDVGDISVEYKVSIEQYVSNHSGGGLGGGLLDGGLGGAKNGGSEEEPTEESEVLEDTEKTKEIDEPKEEIKTIGDDANIKKIGGE